MTTQMIICFAISAVVIAGYIWNKLSVGTVGCIGIVLFLLTGCNGPKDILGNIGSLSAISEENAANNQQVNANIDEILTQIQTVGANCDKMKQISGELENSVAYFHTEKEPAGK